MTRHDGWLPSEIPVTEVIGAAPVEITEDQRTYIWMCPSCGQPLPENERCNSGIHQGPNDRPEDAPLAVRSVDLVEAQHEAGYEWVPSVLHEVDDMGWLNDERMEEDPDHVCEVHDLQTGAVERFYGGLRRPSRDGGAA